MLHMLLEEREREREIFETLNMPRSLHKGSSAGDLLFRFAMSYLRPYNIISCQDVGTQRQFIIAFWNLFISAPTRTAHASLLPALPCPVRAVATTTSFEFYDRPPAIPYYTIHKYLWPALTTKLIYLIVAYVAYNHLNIFDFNFRFLRASKKIMKIFWWPPLPSFFLPHLPVALIFFENNF